MTYTEARNTIVEYLTRVGTNRLSGTDVREAVLIVLDFAAAIDNEDAIPTWTALLTFQTDGSDAGRYCKHPDVNGKKRFFETKTANNINNEPPTDPNITENASWEEISASAGSSIQEYAPGFYGSGLQIVYHNHGVDGSGFYKLTEPVRPFNSVNIETEITSGKWERVGIDSLSAVLARGNDAGTQRVVNLANPVDAQDADTKAARDAAIATAIANLLDSAPGALDTLNELAAALGDDANFATTITNLIALKKNIANDAPTVVTVAGTLTINGVVGSLLTLNCNNREESKFKFVGDTSPLSIELTNFPEGAYAMLTIERTSNVNMSIRFKNKTYLLSNTQLINNGKDALIVRGRSTGRTVAYLGFYRAAETGAENNEDVPAVTNVVNIMKFTEDTQL